MNVSISDSISDIPQKMEHIIVVVLTSLSKWYIILPFNVFDVINILETK